MLPGDTVRLVVPENHRLHGAVGVIAALAPEGWGGYVACPAAATGTFRALYDEMTLEYPDGLPDAAALSIQLGTSAEAPTEGLACPAPVRPAYGGATGDVCSTCGGVNMVRSGACTVCSDCGTSGGCS